MYECRSIILIPQSKYEICSLDDDPFFKDSRDRFEKIKERMKRETEEFWKRYWVLSYPGFCSILSFSVKILHLSPVCMDDNLGHVQMWHNFIYLVNMY